MTLPGLNIISRVRQPADGIAVKTGTAFFVGTTERGAVGAETLVQSMTDYELLCGARAGFTTMYDSAETFFREGGSRLYVGRVVGPAAIAASVDIYDALGSTSTDKNLLATAKSPGAWGNSLLVSIIAGDVAGEFKVQTTHSTDATVNEVSPSLLTPAAAVAWSASSAYLTLTLGVSAAENPRVQGPLSLISGDDDAASIVDATWLAALNGLPKLLGPGQVAAPGRTTSGGHTQVLAHAAAKNRVALLDYADTGTAATLQTAALTDRADINARDGATFAPWGVIPGIAGGTTRKVPWSAVQAGILARNDKAGLSVNEPSAGDNGRPQYAIDLSQPAWTDADRELLNNAGVNVVKRTRNGGIAVYGYRTLANPVTNSLLVPFSNARLYMAIAEDASIILDTFEFKQIDGRGFVLGEVQGELLGMLLGYYRQGALYGATPNDAYTVDVGAQVNTPATLAADELHAVINLRMSPFAEVVTLEIAKTSVTEVV